MTFAALVKPNQGSTSRERSSLPIHRAFVVQFGGEADIERGPFEGRIEHVVSGRATRFHSAEDLFAFLTSLLAASEPKAVEERNDP